MSGLHVQTGALSKAERVIIVRPSPREQAKIDAQWRDEAREWSRVAKKPHAPAAERALESRLHGVIRAAASRGAWEAVEDFTPLDSLMEEMFADDGGAGKAREEAVRETMGWIFGNSPHPAKVMRRIYALTYNRWPELLAHMTMADLGLLLNETKAAFSFRLKVLFPGMQCRSQKRKGSTPNYRKAQLGNRNRARGEKRKRRQQQAGNHDDINRN